MERAARVLLLVALAAVSVASVDLLLRRSDALGADDAIRGLRNHRFGEWPMSSPAAWIHGTERAARWAATPDDRLGGRWAVALTLPPDDAPYRWEVVVSPWSVEARDARTRALEETIARWAREHAPGGVLPNEPAGEKRGEPAGE